MDTAESEYKEYGGNENNGERIDEQGEYAGGLDREMTSKVGKDAKAFVLTLLEKEPFTVLTKWERGDCEGLRYLLADGWGIERGNLGRRFERI